MINFYKLYSSFRIEDVSMSVHKEVPYCFSRSSVKFQGHAAKKIVDFDPNLVFPDCNSSLNSPIALKRCKKLDVVKKTGALFFQRSSIKFQGHKGQKITDFDRIENLRIVTPVWIHPWLWNDAQSLT